MSFYIGIEDLAANALIQVLRSQDKRFLTYCDIEKYGAKVVECLNESGEKAVLILSREYTAEALRNYSDFFEEKEEDGAIGISLKANKKIEDLIEKFRGYLALELLKAFVDKRAVEVLAA
jgi:hypothetical protein